MDIYKRFRIGPIRIYITTRRLKRADRTDDIRHKHKARISWVKRCRYRKNGGRCEVCGGAFNRNALDMHHLIPISERPDLASKSTNLLMVCHSCHMQLHQPQINNAEA